MLRSRRCRSFILIGVAALIQGCATLPDADKFADATAQMHVAVAASGAAVVASLDDAGEKERGEQLRRAWETTVAVTSAMAVYTNAVSDVLKSGTQGAESVRKVASAGQTLAATLGMALAGVKPTVDLLAAIGQHVAQAAAARTLEDVLSRMQPAAENTSELLGRQLDDVETILRAAGALSIVELKASVADERGYLLSLGEERKKHYQKPLDDKIAARLKQIEEVERGVQVKLDPVDRKIAAVEERVKSGRQLIGAARQLAAEWSVAHRQLLAAVQESRSVDPRALAMAVSEIRDLVRKVREE